EAMAALAAAEEAAEAQRQAAEAEAKRVADAAEAARIAAEQAAQAPVVVERMAPAPREAGVSWVDNWVAEYDPATAIREMIAAGRLEFLLVNDKAVQASVKALKGLANIPGVKVVNNKTERRRING